MTKLCVTQPPLVGMLGIEVSVVMLKLIYRAEAVWTFANKAMSICIHVQCGTTALEAMHDVVW